MKRQQYFIACVFPLLMTCSVALQAGQTASLSRGVLTLAAGDYQVDFREAADWAMASVHYKGNPVITFTGANQSVINRRMPDQSSPEAWVGSSHGGETIRDIFLLVDGKKHLLNDRLSKVTGQVYELHKSTQLGPVGAQIITRISAAGIAQKVTLSLDDKEDQLRYAFPLMHCWAPALNEWLAVLADGREVEGSFPPERDRHLHEAISLLALYAEDKNYGALMVYKEAYPGDPGHHNFILNWPGRHNKHYLRLGPQQIGGTVLDCWIVGFEASPSDWKQVALPLADHAHFIP